MKLRKILLVLLTAVCTALQVAVFSSVDPVHAVGDDFEFVDSYWNESEYRDGVTGKLKEYSVWAVSEDTIPFGTELMLSIACRQRKLSVSLTGSEMYPDSNFSGRGTIQVRIDQGKFRSFPFTLNYSPSDKTIFDGVVFGNPKSVTSHILKAKAEFSFKYRVISGSIYPEYHSVSFAIDNFRTFRDGFKSKGCPLN